MNGLYPYLNFNGNCKQAMDFYVEALNGKVLASSTFAEGPNADQLPDEAKNLILHMNISFGDGLIIMASDCPPGVAVEIGNNVSLSVNCQSKAEVDKAFNHLAQGGNVIMPVQDTFWGAYFGMLVDKFGINWMFNYDAPKA